jgi:hypothetical protein
MFALGACSAAKEGQPFDRGAGFVPPKPPPPLLRLERAGTGTCPGKCPTYTVEVSVEGDVAYTGVVNVKTIGPAAGHLSQAAMQQLRTLSAKARPAKMPTERCACGCVENTPTVKLTTWQKSAPKTIAYEEGCERTPHPIRVLEAAVDDLVGVEQWIGTIQQRRLCFEEQRDCSGFGTPKPPEPDAGR